MKKTIVVILLCITLSFLFTYVNLTRTTPTNNPTSEKVSKNTVKTEIEDKPQVCDLSTIQCDNSTEEIETISKFVNETDLVKKISAKYEVDWKLIEAIVIHETGNRTSLAYKNLNNVGGLMGKDGLMRFDTVEESYEKLVYVIKKYYIEKGLTTIEQIQKKYAPLNASNDTKGLNNHWVEGVKSIYDNL